jgi:hypothetical protein
MLSVRCLSLIGGTWCLLVQQSIALLDSDRVGSSDAIIAITQIVPWAIEYNHQN